MTTPEHQFEVVARAYYKLKEMGVKPKLKLLPIGRDTFGLPEEEVHRIRLRAMYFAHGLSIRSTNADTKGWHWPTAKERQTQAA